MAEIFDFGLQKYRLKLSGVYNQNGLFAVVGDTARRVEVQLLDAVGRVTDTTGIELSLSTAIGQSPSYVDANLIDASKGLYQVDLTNGLFLKPGKQDFQWTIYKDGKQINSVISRWHIDKNVSEGGNQSFNFYLNANDLKSMQQDFIDGTVESEALKMSLEERYSNLEADYAQDLSKLKQNDAGLTAQLAQTEQGLISKLQQINSTKADRVELEVERKRIDSFTRLDDGSTTGDAELKDGRVDVNGKEHENIGSAIRSQIAGTNEFVNMNLDLIADGEAVRSSDFLTWEKGYIHAETGVEGNSNNRIASIEFYTPRKHDDKILPTNGYGVIAFQYDLDGNFIKRIGGNFHSDYIRLQKGYKYKFNIRKNDDSDFGEVPTGVLVFTYTDDSELFAPLLSVLEGYYIDINNPSGFFEYSGWNVVYYSLDPLDEYEYEGYSNVGELPAIVYMKDEEVINAIRPEMGRNKLTVPIGANKIAFSVSDSDLGRVIPKRIPLKTHDIHDIVEKAKKETAFDLIVKGIRTVDSSLLIWKRNTLHAQTGEPVNHSRRIYNSEFIEPEEHDTKVTAKDGYGVISFKYDLDGNFIRRVGDTFHKTLVLQVGYKYKLSVRKDDETEFITVPTDTLFFESNDTIRGRGVDNYIPNEFIHSLPHPANAPFMSVETSHEDGGNEYSGLAWSGGDVWKWMKNNEIVISASGYVTIKVSDGSIVNSKEEDVAWDSLSVTKLLSALVAVDYIEDYNQNVVITSRDLINTNVSHFVMAGDTLTYEAILNASLVNSDNNAAESLLRLVGYEINSSATTDDEAKASFLNKMEEKANEIGMTNSSNFRSGAYGMESSPLDLAKMVRHIQLNVPKIKEIWGKPNYEMNVLRDGAQKTWVVNSTTSDYVRNLIPEFVGGKTGSGTVTGVYTFIWTHKDTGELYATAVVNSNYAYNQRFINSRRIIDEVYSLQIL